jgi:hypothetical protein
VQITAVFQHLPPKHGWELWICFFILLDPNVCCTSTLAHALARGGKYFSSLWNSLLEGCHKPLSSSLSTFPSDADSNVPANPNLSYSKKVILMPHLGLNAIELETHQTSFYNTLIDIRF